MDADLHEVVDRSPLISRVNLREAECDLALVLWYPDERVTRGESEVEDLLELLVPLNSNGLCGHVARVLDGDD